MTRVRKNNSNINLPEKTSLHEQCHSRNILNPKEQKPVNTSTSKSLFDSDKHQNSILAKKLKTEILPQRCSDKGDQMKNPFPQDLSAAQIYRYRLQKLKASYTSTFQVFVRFLLRRNIKKLKHYCSLFFFP